MLNIDRVKRILRAKQGSQIPKFQYGNPLTIGSNIPTPKAPPELLQIGSNPIGDQTQANIQAGQQYIQNKVNKDANFDAQGAAKQLHQGFTDRSLYTKDGKIYRKFFNTSQYKNIAEKQKFTDTKFGKGVAKAGDVIGNAILDNSDLIMQGAGSIARNSVDIQGDNFGKFDRTTQNIAAFGKQIGGPAGDVISAFATGVNTWGNVINAIGAKKLQDFSVDKKLQERVGGAYAGSYKDINKAGDMAGKKVGLFANASGKNAFIDEQRRKQAKIAGIDQTNQDMLAMAGNDLNYLNYQMQSNGGYDQMYMGMRAKQGGKLQDKISLVKQRRTISNFINLDTKEIEQDPFIIDAFKEGGTFPHHVDNSSINYPKYNLKLINLWEPETIIFKTGGTITQDWDIIFELPVKQFEEGGKIRTLEELIKYAKEQNPRFIQRLSEEPRGIKFIDDEGNEAEGTHYLESRGEYVIPRIQEINGELKFLSSQDAIEKAIESGNYLKMLPEEAIIFAKDYKQGWPEFFDKFKKGGKTKEELETPEIEETSQKNLIPEGALHKNKHHMEHTEGLTQKGIPVIDNDGEQQAEIELDEIIFTLEVTKKLEELYKKGTDEAAIEAGKLLVKEILFNTDDRTGLIAKCQEGGKL